MASTSALGRAGNAGDIKEDDCSSYYSSEEEEEADTRQLLSDPRSSRNHATPLPASSVVTSTGIYPQLHALAPGDPNVSTPPAAALPLAMATQAAHNAQSQYGSVSSSLPSSGRAKPKGKRYRLPFLILLVFDCGLVVFLSIISYDSQVRGVLSF